MLRSKDVQRLAHVSKDKLISWMRAGIIIPEIDTRGRGSRRLFSQWNVTTAIICLELSKFRIETSKIKEIVEQIRVHEMTHGTHIVITSHGTQVIRCDKSCVIPFGAAIIINIDSFFGVHGVNDGRDVMTGY